LLLLNVHVITLVPPTATVLGAANDLTMLGALDVLVLRVAWAVLPVAVTGVPPSVVVPVGVPVMLVKVVLAALMVTLAVTVHDAPVAKAPPATLMVSVPVMLRPAHVPPNVWAAGKKTMPAGNLSVSPKLVKSRLPAGLVIVKVRVLAAPGMMTVGVKLLTTVGASKTFNGACAGLTLLPLLVCSAPAGMLLTAMPPVLLVTGTLIVQVPGVPAGMLAPLARLMLLPPAVAVTPVPPEQVVLAAGLAATVTPDGKVSRKLATKAALVALLLLNVMVKVDVPPAAMVTGLNTLATVGGLAVLVDNGAVAGMPVNGTGPVAVGALVVLFKVVIAAAMVTPLVVPLPMMMVQLLGPAGKVMPLTLKVLPATEPAPQVPPITGVPTKVMLAEPLVGKVSLTATPVNEGLPAGLLRVKVMVVTSPGAIGFLPNALATTGGAMTLTH
jgi:hypothetical protein